MDLGIPKRIIQTGKSLDLPLRDKVAAVSVKMLNPDFEFLFFAERISRSSIYAITVKSYSIDLFLQHDNC
jgi:hypothetical protein